MTTREVDDGTGTQNTVGDDSAMNDPSDGHCLGCGVEAGFGSPECMCKHGDEYVVEEG